MEGFIGDKQHPELHWETYWEAVQLVEKRFIMVQKEMPKIAHIAAFWINCTFWVFFKTERIK